MPKPKPVTPATIADRTKRGQPIILRTCKVRYAFTRGRGRTKASKCYSVQMTVPAEVAQMVGIRAGDTMLVSGYADGFWVSKGGDLMSDGDSDL